MKGMFQKINVTGTFRDDAMLRQVMSGIMSVSQGLLSRCIELKNSRVVIFCVLLHDVCFYSNSE